MTQSVRDLQIGEMISLTEQWVGPLRATFLSIPEIKELLPKVEADHQDLVAARASVTTAEALLRALIEHANDLDDSHDHWIRAFYFVLLAWIEVQLAQDLEDKANEGERAQTTLLPTQLSIVQATYQAEAGNAAQMVKLATELFEPLLKSIYITSDMTAFDIVMKIGEVGSQLGETERKKSEATAAVDQAMLAPAEIRRRMRSWATTVETVLAAMSLSTAPQATVDIIRKPVLDAATKATERRRARRAAKIKNAPASPPVTNTDATKPPPTGEG